MTVRFSKIDPSNVTDHSHLNESDSCLYLFEYTSGRDYKFSDANSLISNLKKKKGAPGYQHKINAINSVAEKISKALNPQWLKIATLVPIPPSKVIGDPEYDSRMFDICTKVDAGLDVRNLVVQKETTIASHTAGPNRISLEDLKKLYEIDEAIALPEPTLIGIVDDVLTAGTHYRAMHDILSDRFPKAKITGIFIARRIFPPNDAEDFDW